MYGGDDPVIGSDPSGLCSALASQTFTTYSEIGGSDTGYGEASAAESASEANQGAGGGDGAADQESAVPENDIKAGNLKPVSPRMVEDKTGETPHEIKREYLGRSAQISRYDLKRDSASGRLVIIRQRTGEIVEVTHYRW